MNGVVMDLNGVVAHPAHFWKAFFLSYIV
jgi:hypothetical protein